MIRKLKILIIPLLFIFLNVNAQNYYRYQRLINAVDEDIISNDLKCALAKTDTIYKDYDFIYARHCIKALQISCELNDSLKAEIWLKKAFLQGVPKWIIYHNEITKKATTYKNTQQVLADYDALHEQHLSKLNLALRKTVDSLRVLDKKYTDKVNLDNHIFKLVIYNLQWRRNSKKQVKILKPLIAKYGFPAERLIGLIGFYADTTKIASDKKLNLNIHEFRSEIMFIHYFSIKRKSLNSLLLPNVKSGYLEANAYGSFNDFLAKWGKKKYKNYFYNVWHYDPNKSSLSEINKRREAIGLETFERQTDKFKIEFDRRGKAEMYSKINLEINH